MLIIDLWGEKSYFSRYHPKFHSSLTKASLVDFLYSEALFDNRCCVSTWLRSEEHTSELQSRFDLVCRLLLEKKKKWFLSCSASIIREVMGTPETNET